MFKGLALRVPRTELNLTNAHQLSATKRSVSVHKTNCNGRTVKVQVSICKHQYCAAITGNISQLGQNEIPAYPREQVLRWQSITKRVAICERLQSHRPK